MTDPIKELLNDPAVQTALARAWYDSNPGPVDAHEESGFLLVDASGSIVDRRWPTGDHASILVPRHSGCRFEGFEIRATYHTHPNVGPFFYPEPSDRDRFDIRIDRNLKANWYVGEFVVSHQSLYLIMPNGDIDELGAVSELLFAE